MRREHTPGRLGQEYQRRLDSGLCIRCSEQPRRPKRVTCATCGEIDRAKHHARVATGLCVRCARTAAPGKTECPLHAERTRCVVLARRATAEGRILALINAARQRCRLKGLAFDLTLKDLVPFPSRCPVLGLELRYEGLGLRQPNSPSLDRLIPELGYVRGNVLIISWRANNIRGDASASELRRVLRYACSIQQPRK